MSNIKYAKKEENNKAFNIILIIVALLFVGILAFMVSGNKGSNIANHIIEVSYADYLEKIKDDDYTIVLFASPTCSHCVDYKPFVNGIANEYNLDVYYVNVHSSDLAYDEYDAIHDSITATKDQYDKEGLPVIPTPTTVIFKNGVEITSTLGDIGYDGFLKLLKNNNVI